MKTSMRFLLAATMLVIATGPGAAQSVTKVGTTAAKFLSIPAGARALGMGGAFAAVASDASAMYWNPAGLARMPTSEATFSHAQWIADLSYNYAAAAFVLQDFGTIGVSFTSLGTDEMERTTLQSPEGTGEFFDAGSFAVGVSYARDLTEWFSIGGTVKYVSEYIWNTSATGFAIDLGTLFTTPFPGVKFAAAISNFGTKMQMQGDDLLVLKDISQNNGNNPNINANLGTDGFDMPLVMRIGLSWEPIGDEDQQLLLAADWLNPSDNSQYVNFGAEYSGLSRIVSVRAGYRAIGLADSEEQFTLGAGVRYFVLPTVGLKFDYAYEQFGRLNNVHKFAVGVLF